MDELRVERAVSEDELAGAIAKALGVDRERIVVTLSPSVGDFAVRARVEMPRPADRVAAMRAVAHHLEARMLVDDAEGNPRTALLVTANESVRVNVDDGVITGLYQHVDTDEVPDRLVVEQTTWTRGDLLRSILDNAPALDAGFAPDIQDAEHTLISRLRELVYRTTTPDDERVVRRTCAILRASRVVAMSDILRCADGVLAAPWDPAAPA